MCFETTKYQKAKKAKTDITCWKVLRRSNLSIFIGFLYLKGVVQPLVKLRQRQYMSSFECCYVIYEGYHSYQTKEVAERDCSLSDKVVQFIIPAGTRYFASSHYHEYVSETIMRVK